MSAFSKTAPYYEKDGALRAYANRVVLLCALLAIVVAVLAALVVTTRTKPPLVIRVGANGQSTVVGERGVVAGPRGLIQNTGAPAAPSQLEKQNAVLTFISLYWGYDAQTLADHWSKALNMMTGNLEQAIYTKMSGSGVVAKLEGEHATSTVTVTSIDPDQADPMLFHVLATRITNSTRDGRSFDTEKKA